MLGRAGLELRVDLVEALQEQRPEELEAGGREHVAEQVLQLDERPGFRFQERLEDPLDFRAEGRRPGRIFFFVSSPSRARVWDTTLWAYASTRARKRAWPAKARRRAGSSSARTWRVRFRPSCQT